IVEPAGWGVGRASPWYVTATGVRVGAAASAGCTVGALVGFLGAAGWPHAASARARIILPTRCCFIALARFLDRAGPGNDCLCHGSSAGALWVGDRSEKEEYSGHIIANGHEEGSIEH